MRLSTISAVLFSVLALTSLTSMGCTMVTKPADGADGADATASAKSDDTAGKSADAKPADEGGKGGGKAADAEAKKADPKQKESDKKKDDEEKKDKAQKKWDEALEDLDETTGLFTMHHDQQKLLLELDDKALGRPFLYYGALNSGLGNGTVYRGAMLYDNPFVVHFEKRGKKKVVLVADNTAYLDADGPRETRMQKEVLSEGIIRAFSLVAELEHEDRYLIDLGAWFNGDNLQLARGISGGKFSASKDLSLFTDIKSFPRNVEVYQEMVFTGSSSFGGNSTMADGRGLVLRVQHSLVALPSDGYKPRLFDQRVGYFYTERKNLFDRESDDPVKRFINRWRLQKKDPSADVSDPIKQLIYWVENSTPKNMRQAVKEGIEAWEPAFRKAGFSNAIIAKQMPDDADWDPADVRYAVVRWSEDENVGFAIGPSRQDPRTGETFDADITMQASFLNIYAERFETYVAKRATISKQELVAEYEAAMQPVQEDHDFDPRRQCNLMGEEFALQVAYSAMLLDMVAPDKTTEEFLQDMIREVTAHEVGHTLGLRHNFKASTWRPIDQVWDADSTMDTGVCASFMDYPAVAINTPGETQGEFFQSAVGPYDFWAIEYGYTEFGSNEDVRLAKIAAKSHEDGHQFGTDEDSFIGDPFTVVWDMGRNPVDFSAQQIELAEWGLANMTERAVEDGDGFHKYARYYSMFYSMYARSHFGLNRFLGGYTFNRDLVGQEGGRPPIVAVDTELQQQALDLMIEKGLRFDGGIPDDQRLLMANKKFGSFGSWFDFWSMTSVPRAVNQARYQSLIPLMSTTTFERIYAQADMSAESLQPHEVATRVFEAVWPDEPSEHDLWLQSDYVDLALASVRRDTTAPVTALFHDLLRRSGDQLDQYSNNADPTIAAHGRWLNDRLRRFNDRQMVEF